MKNDNSKKYLVKGDLLLEVKPKILFSENKERQPTSQARMRRVEKIMMGFWVIRNITAYGPLDINKTKIIPFWTKTILPSFPFCCSQ